MNKYYFFIILVIFGIILKKGLPYHWKIKYKEIML